MAEAIELGLIPSCHMSWFDEHGCTAVMIIATIVRVTPLLRTYSSYDVQVRARFGLSLILPHFTSQRTKSLELRHQAFAARSTASANFGR
jgi:hypothetical protein